MPSGMFVISDKISLYASKGTLYSLVVNLQVQKFIIVELNV